MADATLTPIYQALCTDPAREDGEQNVWMDVSVELYQSLVKRADSQVRVVYAPAQALDTPAENATEALDVPLHAAGAVGHAFSLIRKLKGGDDVEDALRKTIRRIAASSTDEPPHTPGEPFAFVQDRMYEGEGLSLAIWNGRGYEFSDGDSYAREGDYLDDCKARWLTHYQLEQLLARKSLD